MVTGQRFVKRDTQHSHRLYVF